MKPITLYLAAVVGAALLGFSTGCRPKQESAGAPSAAVESVNRGVSLMGQYDYDGAAKAFEEALAAAPESSVIKINLAIARFNRGRKDDQDIEQAQAEYKKLKASDLAELLERRGLDATGTYTSPPHCRFS